MSEIRLKSTGTIKLFENDNTSNITIASPASLGADRTVTLPDADVTLVSGTMSTVALTGSTNNQVTTVTAANAIQGETNLTYDGTILGCGALGSGADLGVGLHIKTADSGGSADSAADELVIEGSAHNGITFLTGTTQTSTINFGDSGDNNIGIVEYNHNTNIMHMYANAVERLRCAGSGEVVVNDGQVAAGEAVFKVKGAVDNDVAKFSQGNTSGTENMFVFYDGAWELCGTITINCSSNTVAYNESSDYRLKQNETLITDGVTRVKQLKPYRFQWKSDPDNTVDGFFAHEVSSIVPQAISGDKDAFEVYREHQNRPEDKNVGDFKLDDNGDKIPKYQQIDHSKLVPLLTSALKEAITKIETLETKVTALENA
jgi:hypothetical protein